MTPDLSRRVVHITPRRRRLCPGPEPTALSESLAAQRRGADHVVVDLRYVYQPEDAEAGDARSSPRRPAKRSRLQGIMVRLINGIVLKNLKAFPDEYRVRPHDNDIHYDWIRKDG